MENYANYSVSENHHNGLSTKFINRIMYTPIRVPGVGSGLFKSD